jgi:hypothetical protein
LTEFAAFLFLIVLFPTTLIPASLLGLSMTIVSLTFAHVIGNWVDKYPRLWVARWALFVQKVSPFDGRGFLSPRAELLKWEFGIADGINVYGMIR